MKMWNVNGRQVLLVKANELTYRNLMRVTSGLTGLIRSLLLPNAVWVAGGALRSAFDKTPVADYDLFFESPRYVSEVVTVLKRAGARQVFDCPEGKLKTFELGGVKIQLITPRYYSTSFDLVGSFDFTVCQFAFDGEYVTLGRDGIRDAKIKKLVVQRLEYPVATLNRIGKYRWGKGYFMAADDWASLIWSIQGSQFRTENLQMYID